MEDNLKIFEVEYLSNDLLGHTQISDFFFIILMFWGHFPLEVNIIWSIWKLWIGHRILGFKVG